MGAAFAPILFIVFLVLKLTHYIDWPWVWVTAPLWIGGVVGLVAVIIWAIFYKSMTRSF